MEVIALILFVLSTSGTPGPNNLMILSSGVNHGFKPSLPHMFGINFGFPIMIICVGIGALKIFADYPILHTVLKVTGLIYLTYLAWKIASTPVNAELKETAKPFSFLQAAGFQWLNPKAWVMAITALVTFSSQAQGSYQELATIAGCYLLFGLPCTLLWLSIGCSLQQVLNDAKKLRVFNLGMATILIASIMPTIFELLPVSV